MTTPTYAMNAQIDEAVLGYDQFIAQKSKQRIASGFEPEPIKSQLFDWQKAVVR